MKKILITTSIIFSFILAFSYAYSVHAAAPVKILLVPGHDAEIWGAQYGMVKEANMNLAVAKRIYNALKKDKRFEVFITRNNAGYTKEFTDYFSLSREDIISFRQEAREATRENMQSGQLVEREGVPHNNVTEDVSVILYGINKWASENEMDAVIHIHFNDYPRQSKWTVGKHHGFVIYMPDGQMPNGFASGQLAADIFSQLDKKYDSSTYEPELGGLIPDQTLIALGSNGTLPGSVRSVLIEYGYIYEKMFRGFTSRHRAYNAMASLTSEGIKRYFFPK